MPYVNHKLGRTFYLSKGPDKGVPLVFLHGGPGGRHDSNKPLLKLGKKRKVFLYDQIGGGKSSSIPMNQWKIETFVDELHCLIEKWKLPEFHLAGGSWGTTLALEYYLRTRDPRIKSLIFKSPMFSAHDWRRDANKLISELPAKVRRAIKDCQKIGTTDSQVYKDAMTVFYLRHVLRNEKKLKALMNSFENKNKNGKKIYQYMWGPSEFEPTGTLKKYDRVKGLRRIMVPALLVCGEFDEATPTTVRKYGNLMRNSEVRVLKGCSHASLLENPKLLLRTIDGFLEKVDR